MILLAAVDDHLGLMFHNRRQSQDRALREKMLSLGEPLWMSPYSAKQFGDSPIYADPDFLSKAGHGAYCFVEDADILPIAREIEKIILFRWNRVYPGDTFFPIDLGNWHLESGEDFPGHSHEKITMEVYTRCV